MKGKQPKCKNCGHVYFMHRPFGKCRCIGCDCKGFIPEDENDHRFADIRGE